MSEKKSPTAPVEVMTASRIRAWYMVQFRGYTVAQCREVPRVSRLGRLTYSCLWHLRAPSTASS
jgi:hypothetical protein